MHLELLYVPIGMSNGYSNPFAPDISMTSLERFLKSGVNGTETIENERGVINKKKEVIVRGVLSVTVISAEELPAVDLLGKADPYVVITLKKSEMRNKTRVTPWLPILSSFTCFLYVFPLGICLVSLVKSWPLGCPILAWS